MAASRQSDAHVINVESRNRLDYETLHDYVLSDVAGVRAKFRQLDLERYRPLINRLFNIVEDARLAGENVGVGDQAVQLRLQNQYIQDVFDGKYPQHPVDEPLKEAMLNISRCKALSARDGWGVQPGGRVNQGGGSGDRFSQM